MTICLSIESSCDDSSVALVSSDGCVHELITQSHLQCLVPFQGIMPEVVSREHIKYLPALIDTIRQRVSLESVDLIAYTAGPGLAGSLLVGASMAHSLSLLLKKPLVPIHHLEGHHYAYLLEHSEELYPSLSLIVSGGHTQLMLVSKPHSYEIIGKTRDDAAGEAFDKIAKKAGFDYPGGPKLAKAAEKGNPLSYKFTTPLAQPTTLDFSFSGLKTQAIRSWEERPDSLADYCASVEATIAQTITLKTKQALKQHSCKSLILSGGVACNNTLRTMIEALAQSHQIPVLIASPQYCADNAAMIAMAALKRWENNPTKAAETTAPLIRPSWSIESISL